jgi:hypothetical protein
MKYSIPEDKLNNVIFKYLDVHYGDVVERRGVYNQNTVYTKPGSESQFGLFSLGVYDHREFIDMYVTYYLIQEIKSFFQVENYDALMVIKEWVKRKYNVDIAQAFYSTPIEGRVTGHEHPRLKIRRESINEGSKENTIQKLIDEFVNQLKHDCETINSEDDEFVSFEACDLLNADGKLTVMSVERHEGSLLIVLSLTYESYLNIDEYPLFLELKAKLRKTLGIPRVLLITGNIENTFSHD